MQLVHADLKPDNILVSPAALKGNFKVKVIDFGFARSAWEEGGYEFRGTPGYVAPEVGSPPRGKAPCISAASDMFSFGVILLEMLLFLNLTWCQRDTDKLTRFLDHLMASTTRDELRNSSARWTELCGRLFDRVLELFPEGEFAPRLELLCPEALDFVWQLTREDPTLRLSARAALCHSLIG